MDSSSKYLDYSDPKRDYVHFPDGYAGRDRSDALFIDEISTYRLKEELRARGEYPPSLPSMFAPVSPPKPKQSNWSLNLFLFLMCLGVLVAILAIVIGAFQEGYLVGFLVLGILSAFIGFLGVME